MSKIDWQNFSGATPLDKWILLWFVGNDAPKEAHMPVVGQVSYREGGKIWDGHSHRPREWFSHWANYNPPNHSP